MSKRIEELLKKALLIDGEMEYGLYEHELEKHIDYWRKGMAKDKDDFVFVVTENRSHVAMLLLRSENERFINKEARDKLQQLWSTEAYLYNLKKLIPAMAKDLADGILSVNGVKYQ